MSTAGLLIGGVLIVALVFSVGYLSAMVWSTSVGREFTWWCVLRGAAGFTLLLLAAAVVVLRF